MIRKRYWLVWFSLSLLLLTTLCISMIVQEGFTAKDIVIAIALLALYLQYRIYKRENKNIIFLADAVNDGHWPKAVNPDRNEYSNKLFSLYNKSQEVIDYVKKMDQPSYEFKYMEEDNETRLSLEQIKQAQLKHLKDEEQRHWKTEGLAKFGEIVRKNGNNLEDLSNQVLSNLVRYIDGNQGSFFIEQSDTENRVMKLTACYAYDRKKYLEKTVQCGEGLTGQVMLEKEPIYMTDIPEDYINITSGLGEALPSNILIMPLMVNEEFYGAIELASFNLIEGYKREFLDELSVVIASAIASVKVNANTKKLLQEAQMLTSELQSKEEEMRQNMEELQATQEEMQRGQVELNGVFGAINTSQGMAEFDSQRNLIMANEWLTEILKLSEDEIKNNADLLLPKKKDGFWSALSNGQTLERELMIKNSSGDHLWINATYSPIMRHGNEFYKALALFTDITKRKQREKEFQRLSLVADNTDNAVVITDARGRVEYVNKGFEEMSGYSEAEMLGKIPGRMLQGPDTDEKTIQTIGKKLKNGESLYEEILNYTKAGKSYWISLAINPVRDVNGKIEKFISVQADITETKKAALDYQYKLEAIDRSNAVIEFDLEGNIITANDNFLKIVGYELSEIQDKHHSIFLHPNDQGTKEYKAFWAELAKGKFINHEFKRLHKNGNDIWLRGIYNPMLDMNGNPVKIIKFATDVTNEKELALRTENQRRELSSHLETINKTIATLEFDSDKRIISANNIFLDVSGYKEDELKGKPYNILLPPEEVDKPQNQMMWESLLNGKFFTGQFRQRSKDGNDLWLLGTFNPVMSESGELESIKMFAQFNTHSKEKEISMSQIIGALQKSIPVIELNPDGTCCKANDMFYEIFKTSRMNLRNKTLNEFFETDFSQKQLLSIIKKVQKEHVIEETVSHVSDIGEVKIYRAVFNPIMKGENELSRVLVILMDKEVILHVSRQ